MKNSTIGFVSIAALLVGGCGGSGTPTLQPSLTIISPSDNATPTLGTDAQLSLAVSFTTVNFLLKAAGSSNCGVGCGHVNLLIDGAGCNSGTSTHNNQAALSPVNALFASCATPAGDHMLTLELHNNDDSPLLDAAGKTISSSVGLKTMLGNSGIPSIAITSPAAGDSVALGVDVNKSVPIIFTTANFTLAAAGTASCGSGCGHVNIAIDGTACDAMGSSYNATGSASPISALFGLCATAAGTHTVGLSLENNDNSPVTAATTTTVTFTTH